MVELAIWIVSAVVVLWAATMLMALFSGLLIMMTEKSPPEKSKPKTVASIKHDDQMPLDVLLDFPAAEISTFIAALYISLFVHDNEWVSIPLAVVVWASIVVVWSLIGSWRAKHQSSRSALIKDMSISAFNLAAFIAFLTLAKTDHWYIVVAVALVYLIVVAIRIFLDERVEDGDARHVQPIRGLTWRPSFSKPFAIFGTYIPAITAVVAIFTGIIGAAISRENWIAAIIFVFLTPIVLGVGIIGEIARRAREERTLRGANLTNSGR